MLGAVVAATLRTAGLQKRCVGLTATGGAISCVGLSTATGGASCCVSLSLVAGRRQKRRLVWIRKNGIYYSAHISAAVVLKLESSVAGILSLCSLQNDLAAAYPW